MKNRFMLTPLTNQQSNPGGSASRADIEWTTRVAQGGFALAQTCATTVQATGIAFPGQLGIHDDSLLPGLTAMADAMRNGGALSAVQLHHAGHRARRDLGGVPAPASDGTAPGAVALTTEQVEHIRDDFIRAAKRAERAGFDGVAVHGAFGWILSEFLSPLLNQRTLDEGCDFVLIGRGAILQPDFPEQVRRDPAFVAPPVPVSAAFLRANGLSEPFIHYMATAWDNFVTRGVAA